MRILLLTPTLPYPQDTGGRIVVFNTIKHLAKRHEIFLLSLIQEGQQKYVPFLKDYCISIETVLKDISFSKKGLFLNLFCTIPYNMTRYHSPEMEEKLKEIISKNHFDLVQIEHLHMAQYAKFVRKTPVILRQHNVESVMMERYYRYASNFLERIYAYFQWRKLLRYERKMCLTFDLVITLSKVDEGYIKKLTPQIKTEVVSCGVDFEYFDSSSSPRKTDKIVYIGGLVFKPAFEGIFCFLKDIWPEIRKHYPGIKFHIVGKCPPDKYKKIKNMPDVTFLGYVEDVRTHMSNSTLGIVPYRIASGIRLKILESMAMKLPLVSTSIGCEGLDVVDGEHILIADTPKTFAWKVIRLLKDEDLRNRLADNAFKLVKKKYSWGNAVQKLEQIYKRYII
jgi:glycosyltransferase involved in cell wall biosynthesis